MNQHDDAAGRARRRRWIIYPALGLLAIVAAGLIALGQTRYWPHIACFDTPPPGAGTALSNATAPACSYQQVGHVETLAGARMTHHYVRSRDLTWHVVTAGDRARPAVVFLHGLPESWFSFHHQMADLSRDRFVVALDVPPYGQTEKSSDIDYAYPALAARVVALVADIGLDEFDLVAHDRGAVIGDHMAHVIATDAGAPRMRRYVRMQQSGNEPHGEPKPPHGLMGSVGGSFVFSGRGLVRTVYSGRLVALPIPDDIVERTQKEFSIRGTAWLARHSFATTSFEKELEDRLSTLFASMSMPVLFLQGRLDPGQHEEEYAAVTTAVADGYLRFVEAGHFLHVEAPDEVSRIVRSFLDEAPPQPAD